MFFVKGPLIKGCCSIPVRVLQIMQYIINLGMLTAIKTKWYLFIQVCYIAMDSGIRISWCRLIFFLLIPTAAILYLLFQQILVLFWLFGVTLTCMLDTLIICNSANTEQTPLPNCFHQRFHWRKLMAMSDESYSIAFSAALIVNNKTSVMITLSL